MVDGLETSCDEVEVPLYAMSSLLMARIAPAFRPCELSLFSRAETNRLDLIRPLSLPWSSRSRWLSIPSLRIDCVSQQR